MCFSIYYFIGLNSRNIKVCAFQFLSRDEIIDLNRNRENRSKLIRNRNKKIKNRSDLNGWVPVIFNRTDKNRTEPVIKIINK